LPVVLCKAKGRDRDLVVKFAGGLLIDIAFGDLDGLLDVSGEEALVEWFLGRENRIAPEPHAEEFEPEHVTADHHETDCQRRR
jgi:hypothetical protein